LAKEFGIDPHDLLAQQQALFAAEQAREKKVREERQKAIIEPRQRIGEQKEHHTTATIHLPPVCQPSPEHEIMQGETSSFQYTYMNAPGKLYKCSNWFPKEGDGVMLSLVQPHWQMQCIQVYSTDPIYTKHRNFFSYLDQLL